MALDPVTLAVLQNGLMQVCNEMDLAFVRSAFSPVIAEALDRSDGIYHRSTGELIAQGELGLPVFVGTMQFSVQAVIERVERLRIPLEERTGRSWSELAQQYVLGPLDIENTSVPAPDDVRTPGTLGGFSAGLFADGTADCAVSLDLSAKSSSMGAAAAGAVSTLEDAKRLSEAFATGALLTEATARKVWDTVPPGADVPSWYAQGLGGMQYGPLRGTAGETAGSLTAAFTEPETGLTVVVALDNSTSGAAFVREVAFALASIGSKAAPAADREMPLVELPWSLDQAKAKMNELAVCPLPEGPAES